MKLVVFGIGGVGKSALVNMFVKKHFIEFYDVTVEDTYKTSFDLDGRSVMLDILDTAGQDDFTPMRASWIRRGEGFLLVYAINDSISFEGIETIHRDIKQIKGNDDAPIVVVGNKSDLPNRLVTSEDGKRLADRYRAAFMETSAKTGEGVDEAFRKLVERIMEKKMPASPPAVVRPEAPAIEEDQVCRCFIC